MTGSTEAEFTALLPHFEQALVTYMQDRTIDGQPRTSRRDRPYKTCPLLTVADKLLCILTYVKQNPIQEVQGQLLGMSQSHANKWIHRLHPVLTHALAVQALLPARTADDLATMLTPSAPGAPARTLLFFMMGPNDPPNVQKTRRSSKSRTGQEDMPHAQTPPRDQGELSHVLFECHL